MTRDELLEKLIALHDYKDWEDRHWIADYILLDFINDPAISEAFDTMDKWYA